MDALTRVIERLAHATTQHTRRTLGLQVEVGQYSVDVARSLQQITAAVETLQTSMFASGGATDGTDSEVSSRSRVSAVEKPIPCRSSSRQDGIPSGSSIQAGRRGRK